jgi:hypothetical protein
MMDEARAEAVLCYMSRNTFLLREQTDFALQDGGRMRREANHSDGPSDNVEPCWTMCGDGWDSGEWKIVMTENKDNSASSTRPVGFNFLATLGLSTMLNTRTRILVPLLLTAWSGQTGAMIFNEKTDHMRSKHLEYNLKVSNALLKTLEAQLEKMKDYADRLEALYEDTKADMGRHCLFPSYVTTKEPQPNYISSEDSPNHLTAFINILGDIRAYLDKRSLRPPGFQYPEKQEL